MKFSLIFTLILVVISCSEQQSADTKTAELQTLIEQKASKFITLSLQKLKDVNSDDELSRQALLLFLTKFPKGADLHSHMSGAIRPEAFLEWAVKDQLCVMKNDSTSSGITYHKFQIVNCLNDQKDRWPANDIAISDKLKSEVYQAWSMNGFRSKSADIIGDVSERNAHFFKTFDLTDLVTKSAERNVDMLQEILVLAAKHNTLYLELMRSLERKSLHDTVNNVKWDETETIEKNIIFLFNHITKSDQIEIALEKVRKDLISEAKKLDNILQCHDIQNSPICSIEVRFLAQIKRNQSRKLVFAEMVLAFALANELEQVVGLNMVNAEQSKESVQGYDTHMEMIKYLSKKFPEVKVTLHAGELTKRMFPSGQHPNHIKKALEIASPDRIGHGVSISQESNSASTLQLLQKNRIPIEINLSSNHFILDVFEKNHPLRTYLKANVPMVISTDNQGTFDTDLSFEYLKAVEENDLTYTQIKNISRNSLHFSFLQGNSLWNDDHYNQKSLQINCKNETLGSKMPKSRSCSSFLNKNTRARVQWELERRFHEFEKKL